MKFTKTLTYEALVVLLAVLNGCPALSLVGCSADYWAGAYKPSTEFNVTAGFAKMWFKDSKDNDILLENVQYNPTSKALVIGKLSIRNNGSDVVRSTGDRALQVAVAQEVQVRYVDAVGNLIEKSIKAGVPLAQVFARIPMAQESGFELDIPGIGPVKATSNTMPVIPVVPTVPQPTTQPAVVGSNLTSADYEVVRQIYADETLSDAEKAVKVQTFLFSLSKPK